MTWHAMCPILGLFLGRSKSVSNDARKQKRSDFLLPMKCRITRESCAANREVI